MSKKLEITECIECHHSHNTCTYLYCRHEKNELNGDKIRVGNNAHPWNKIPSWCPLEDY